MDHPGCADEAMTILAIAVISNLIVVIRSRIEMAIADVACEGMAPAITGLLTNLIAVRRHVAAIVIAVRDVDATLVAEVQVLVVDLLPEWVSAAWRCRDFAAVKVSKVVIADQGELLAVTKAVVSKVTAPKAEAERAKSAKAAGVNVAAKERVPNAKVAERSVQPAVAVVEAVDEVRKARIARHSAGVDLS